jgi:4-carboxymuconolactone decarboxylase
MTLDDLYQRGLALRQKLFGADTVARRMDELGTFGEPLQHIINAYSYGDIWSRPQLDMKARSLAMVGITATLNKPNELKVHVNGALNNGASTDEVREVLLMVTLYAGLPTGIDAHKAALEVINARSPAPAAPAA